MIDSLISVEAGDRVVAVRLPRAAILRSDHAQTSGVEFVLVHRSGLLHLQQSPHCFHRTTCRSDD